jgi:hypothetical protein
VAVQIGATSQCILRSKLHDNLAGRCTSDHQLAEQVCGGEPS